MPQQTSFMAVLHSESMPQSLSPWLAGSQIIFNVASEVRMHALPCEVSQVVSSAQYLGQLLALWQI